MPDAPNQWEQADEPEPRVHPLLAHELGTLLAEWARARLTDGYISRGPTEQDDCGLWLRDRLEYHGWKIEPSRQRRMQLAEGEPPPTLPHL